MTIEAKLEALTKAVEANTVALIGRPQVQSRDKPVAATTAKAAPPEGSVAVSYDMVKVPFLALVKKNRDTALAVLKPFGLDNLKGAKPEQLPAIFKAVNKALADSEAAA